MIYFGSKIVEDVAESWVEAGMSWVEVDGGGWRWVQGLVIPLDLKVFLLNYINYKPLQNKLLPVFSKFH